MKILTTVFADIDDHPDVCPPEFVLIDLTSAPVRDSLRRWRAWARVIEEMHDENDLSQPSAFSYVVIHDRKEITTLFNDPERRVIGPYLVNPDKQLATFPYLGGMSYCIVGDEMDLFELMESDDDDAVITILNHGVYVTSDRFFVRCECEIAGIHTVQSTDWVPWSVVDEWEKAQEEKLLTT